MIITRKSENYNFTGNTENGITFRWAKTFEENPQIAPWPELADISISNHCSKGCDFCYRNSTVNNSFLSIDNYELILKNLQSERWGNVFQVALGGGEPLEHPDFFDIIDLTNKFNIIPNFTTNGINLNEKTLEKLQNKVGAIAISVVKADEFVLNKKIINLIKNFKIKFNIHFVLNDETINHAIDILTNKPELLNIINGLIFLTYKPKGRGDVKNCLKKDERYYNFLNLVNKSDLNIGFDACFVPSLLHHTHINKNFIDSCECAFFSVYIDELLNVKPCSFGNDKYSYNLKDFSFEEIWNNKFNDYRSKIVNNCSAICSNKSECKGKCIYFDEINFCYK